MVDGLIGKKVGMTQLFAEDGRVTPVTVLEVGPCVVVQRKTVDRDGYEAVQVGLVDAKSAKRANKPMRGHHEKAGVPPTRLRRESRLVQGADGADALKAGDALSVEVFAGVTHVDVIGRSKGKGFQGVMRRHGFGGGKATHGSMFHRAPGSIGQSASPSRVLRGMRAPGHQGDARITVKNLTVVRIDGERNLMLVRGAVPGSRGSLLWIRRSRGVAAAKAEA